MSLTGCSYTTGPPTILYMYVPMSISFVQYQQENHTSQKINSGNLMSKLTANLSLRGIISGNSRSNQYDWLFMTRTRNENFKVCSQMSDLKLWKQCDVPHIFFSLTSLTNPAVCFSLVPVKWQPLHFSLCFFAQRLMIGISQFYSLQFFLRITLACSW